MRPVHRAIVLLVAGGCGSIGEDPGCGSGDTRTCVGPAGCAGGQYCDRGAWTACDCGADAASESKSDSDDSSEGAPDDGPASAESPGASPTAPDSDDPSVTPPAPTRDGPPPTPLEPAEPRCPTCCDEARCEEALAFGDACCDPADTCGVARGAGCVALSVFDEDCDDGEDSPGCCADGVVCGTLDAEGACVETVIDAASYNRTTCEGGLDFRCGVESCEGVDEHCCTPDGECGFELGGTCLADSQVDPDCVQFEDAPGCCAEGGYCGRLTPEGCVAVVGEARGCDGALRPFTCGDVVCVLPEALADAIQCCVDDGTCGVDFGSGCIEIAPVDSDCPPAFRDGNEVLEVPGCCIDTERCGVISVLDGGCEERPASSGDTLALCDGSEGFLCGDGYCTGQWLESLEACCTQSGSCGFRVSEDYCAEPEQIDIDCAGLCCADDGYCGELSSEGCALANDGTGIVQSCEGSFGPFACGAEVCAGFDAIAGAVPCCQFDGSCGGDFGAGCVSLEALDLECNNFPGFSCCLDGMLCGAIDPGSGECGAEPSGLEESIAPGCDGEWVTLCGDLGCPVPVGTHGSCCTNQGECGMPADDTETAVCVDLSDAAEVGRLLDGACRRACQDAASADPDGDGIGAESGRECVVFGTPISETLSPCRLWTTCPESCPLQDLCELCLDGSCVYPTWSCENGSCVTPQWICPP